MSMSTDEPGVATAARAADVELPLEIDVSDSESGGAVYQAGFNGWLAFADVLSEVDPDIADVMMASAYVARATLEDEIPSLLDGVREALGLSRSGLDGLATALGADNLELTPEEAAEMLFAGTTDVVRAFQESPSEFPLMDAAIAGFLKTRLVTGSAGFYEETRRKLSEHQPSTDFAHWRATCSLDLPAILGRGQQPIYCARRGHRELGTKGLLINNTLFYGGGWARRGTRA